LAIRTNNDAGGNHVLVDKDELVAKTTTVEGAAVFKGGVDLWGGQLAFKEAGGAENNAPLRLSRVTTAGNADLRVQIGGAVGGIAAGLFSEQFSVTNNGNVRTAGGLVVAGAANVGGQANVAGNLAVGGSVNIGGSAVTGGTVNGRNMIADGNKLDGISPNA